METHTHTKPTAHKQNKTGWVVIMNNKRTTRGITISNFILYDRPMKI